MKWEDSNGSGLQQRQPEIELKPTSGPAELSATSTLEQADLQGSGLGRVCDSGSNGNREDFVGNGI